VRVQHAILVGLLLVSFVFVAASPGILVGPAEPAHPSMALPVFITKTKSTNWGGYAVTGPSGSVTMVSGSWVEPKVVGSCPSSARYASFWVGIDGYSSSTVEQTGTDVDCSGGQAAYYAWYEFYPAASVNIGSVPIHPGDVISAKVTSSGASFKVSLTDATTRKSFSITKTVGGAKRDSAEWIVESPEICSTTCTIAKLTDFGTADLKGTNEATVSGTTAHIGKFSTVVEITLMNSSNTKVRAMPSALSSGGSSFTVVWKSA
jgi:hypothetical protein